MKIVAPIYSMTDVVSRVFPIKIKLCCSESYGTAFTLDHKNSQYLITAAHVVAGSKTNDEIELYYNDKWNSHVVKFFKMGNPKIVSEDIAVLNIGHLDSIGTLSPSNLGGIMFGQNVSVFGFPKPNSTFPLDLVRNLPPMHEIKGTRKLPFNKNSGISNIIFNNKSNKNLAYVLDDSYCRGMSGGPAIFDNNFNSNKRNYVVFGVLSQIGMDENVPLRTGSGTCHLPLGFSIVCPIVRALELIEFGKINFSL